MPNQKTKAANEGDVMKHAPLQKVIDHHSNGKSEFWYVETHTAYPYYFLPPEGSWEVGIGHLVTQLMSAPQLLQEYHPVAYHDKQGVADRFPDKRAYIGSAAQVFHVLKTKKVRIRMTLFEREAEPAEELWRYFVSQGANTVLVRTGENFDSAGRFLRASWEGAVQAAGDNHLVMVVQGDSYKLAPFMWKNTQRKPDFVLVDPFKVERGQPKKILKSLHEARVPFMSWTPLFRVPKWPAGMWSFESGKAGAGAKGAKMFVEHCRKNSYHLAWFSWSTSSGATYTMYGCQLTFGNVFDQQFTPASVWTFAQQGLQLPYFDCITAQTTWQTPGQKLIQNAPPISMQNQPGAQFWCKYHAAFWWP